MSHPIRSSVTPSFQPEDQELGLIEFRKILDNNLVTQEVALVPRPRGSKAVSFGFTNYYERTPAIIEEVRSWKDIDRAAVCGVNGLRVIDIDGFDHDGSWSIFDRYESWQVFYRLFDRKIGDFLTQNTLIVVTSRGIQIWYLDSTFDDTVTNGVIDARPVLPVELFLHHHLASVPGNLHPSGETYHLLKNDSILRKDGLTEQLILRLQSFGCAVQLKEKIVNPRCVASKEMISAGIPARSEVIAGDCDLTNEQITVLSKFLVQLWRRGERHRLLVGFAGWFLRLGISETSAASFLSSMAIQLEPNWQRRLEVSKVRALYNTASKKQNARIPGLSTVVDIAQAHGRDDLATEILSLNKQIKESVLRRKSIRSEVNTWKERHGLV